MLFYLCINSLKGSMNNTWVILSFISLNLIFVEYKYTNGDVGTGEGGAVTPTQTPLPEAPLDNAMGYNYEPNHNLGK